MIPSNHWDAPLDTQEFFKHHFITEANKEERTDHPVRYREYPLEIPVESKADKLPMFVDVNDVGLMPSKKEQYDAMVYAWNDGYRHTNETKGLSGRYEENDDPSKALYYPASFKGRSNEYVPVNIEIDTDEEKPISYYTAEELFKAQTEYAYGYEKQGPDPKFLQGNDTLLQKNPSATHFYGVSAKDSGYCHGYNYYKNK